MFVVGSARAESRYYLLQTDYQWEMFATEDDATLAGTGEHGEIKVDDVEFVRPLAARDPLNMTLLMRVDDANVPGRKARVTFWFKRIACSDKLRHWTLTDFADADALRRRARGFLAQPRMLHGVPTVLAYGEEALGVILALAHGQSMLIDLDVPPDRIDPLIYQADALIASIISDEPGAPIDEKHGVAWLESNAAATSGGGG